jgi:hypothetical protein
MVISNFLSPEIMYAARCFACKKGCRFTRFSPWKRQPLLLLLAESGSLAELGIQDSLTNSKGLGGYLQQLIVVNKLQ